MNDPERQVENLRESLQEGDRGGSDADREALLDFSDELKLRATEYTDHRHLKLLRHCTRMAEEVGGLADALEDREAAEEIVRWIHDTYDNEETNRDYRVALRVFGRHLTNGDGEPPESIAWVNSSTTSSYDPTPDPGQMLRWEEDVVPMIEATFNARDKAMIALQFDAGLRGGEFMELTVGDISDNDYGLQVRVDGKQGQRSVTLIPSVPYVTSWLSEHPGDDPDDPLWSKLNSPESTSYSMLTKVFRKAGERAGVEKPVSLTNFRKSSAAHLASKGMSQAHIESHHGWVTGSRAASRYISIFGEEGDRELAKVYGKEIEEKSDDEIAPLTCPRCDRETPREKELCVWCGQALEPGAAERVEELDDMLVDAIADAEGDDARKILQLREDIRSDPEVVDELIGELAPLLDTDDE